MDTSRSPGPFSTSDAAFDVALDLLERLWERNNLSERDAKALAVEAQQQTRRRRR